MVETAPTKTKPADAGCRKKGNFHRALFNPSQLGFFLYRRGFNGQVLFFPHPLLLPSLGRRS
jgi:hypothetical protein